MRVIGFIGIQAFSLNESFEVAVIDIIRNQHCLEFLVIMDNLVSGHCTVLLHLAWGIAISAS
jgi:hypothetical protein